MNLKNKNEEYYGFEQGPIRPPSEAYSLLIRVTRNCPWNRCSFCPVYKGTDFSIRPVEHIKKDIETVNKHVQNILKLKNGSGKINGNDISNLANDAANDEEQAFNAAVHWFSNGMNSVFIQDANSLIIKPHELIEILTHIKKYFPWVERITSYARSHTIARISDEDLKGIKEAGLNRIHIGMESASDEVLKMIKKGVDKETHIKAGIKVKNAGIELSEYVMPGLGGKKLSKIHAKETALALNQINPDFIRLRTLAIPNKVELFSDFESGYFEKCTDIMVTEEILTFIETLDGISSIVKSDHILNLFEEVQGKLPQDKNKMVNILQSFLEMPPDDQCLYQVGRRLGIFSSINDMNNIKLRGKAKNTCQKLGITPKNVDQTIDELMKRFI